MLVIRKNNSRKRRMGLPPCQGHATKDSGGRGRTSGDDNRRHDRRGSAALLREDHEIERKTREGVDLARARGCVLHRGSAARDLIGFWLYLEISGLLELH